MDQSTRMLAHRVIYTLWPEMPAYNKEHVTPEVAAYVFVVYQRAKVGNQIIQGLKEVLMPHPPTAWKDIPEMLLKAVQGGINANFEERGWALRSMLSEHGYHVKQTLQYGPDTYPLSLHSAFEN